MPSEIDEFEKKLTATAKTYGGRSMRADFHLHSPTSHDYEYNATDVYDKLSEAINKTKLSYAVVLEHQDFPSESALEKIREKCPNTLIVPGAELNFFVDAMSAKVDKDHFYHVIVGV